MDRRARLLELLRTKSFRRGNFTLASGKKSDIYLDCRVVSLDAEGATLLGELFFEHLQAKGLEYGAVGGLSLGADPLVTATSIASYRAGRPVPGLLIRKEPKGHGLGQWIEGRANVAEGMPVVLLDDVITTGGSARLAYERARAEGLNPVCLLAIVDRLEGGREALADLGIPIESLYTRHDFIPPEG